MGLITGLAAHRWPGGCAPYTYDEGQLSPTEIGNINSAVASINGTGAIRLIRRTTQTRYIDIIPDYQPLDGTCWSSHIGQSGARQEVKLDPGAGVGVIIHELCHALGISHEHQRPDRDTNVGVNTSAVKLHRQGDFAVKSPPASVVVGAYDFASIMHYGPSQRASTDGSTRVITPRDPSQRIGQRSGLSSGDVGALRALSAGNAMVVGLDAQGQIGSVADLATWTPGWSVASPYSIGASRFLFLLKTSDGRMHINDVGQNGTVGAIRDNRDWSAGWTTGLAYRRGSQACLLLYKAGTGLMRLHTLAANGTVGPMFEESQASGSGMFGTGWTSIVHYSVGNADYLIFLREGTGEMQVIGVGWNGGLGQRLQWADWSSGWTSVCPFTTGGGSFLFLLKAGTGQMHVNTIAANGTIGAKQHEASWSAGWTTALPYRAGNTSYLFLLKAATGDVHINRIDENGAIGPITDVRQFGAGWTTAAVTTIGTGTFLLLVKA